MSGDEGFRKRMVDNGFDPDAPLVLEKEIIDFLKIKQKAHNEVNNQLRLILENAKTNYQETTGKNPDTGILEEEYFKFISTTVDALRNEIKILESIRPNIAGRITVDDQGLIFVDGLPISGVEGGKRRKSRRRSKKSKKRKSKRRKQKK